MTVATISKKIEQLMEHHHIYGTVVAERAEERMVAVEITWGDWKHDHMRLDHVVENFFHTLRRIGTCITEEDGSDCYSAIHRYYFY